MVPPCWTVPTVIVLVGRKDEVDELCTEADVDVACLDVAVPTEIVLEPTLAPGVLAAIKYEVVTMPARTTIAAIVMATATRPMPRRFWPII